MKYDKLQTGVKKFAYVEISKELSALENVSISYEQVESKWKGLQRTYKKVKEENNSTGNSRRQWTFYDAMHEILHKAPEISPPAVVSSDDSSVIINIDCPDIPETEQQEQPFCTNLKRKRTSSQSDAREEAIAKRHSERMAASNRFLDLFEKMIDKM